MKFAVGKEHKAFFEKHKLLELEGVFSSDEVSLLNDEVIRVLSRRGSTMSPEQDYEAGRDLWRESEAVRKKICSRRIVELLYQLTEKRPIRLGFDQYFPEIDADEQERGGNYAGLLRSSYSLQEMCSIQGVIGGFCLALKGSSSQDSEEDSPFPSQKGNVSFLHPERVMHYPSSSKGRGGRYYLVVYSSSNSLYIRNRNDPLSGTFIQLGYSSGDRLVDNKNPLVF